MDNVKKGNKEERDISEKEKYTLKQIATKIY